MATEIQKGYTQLLFKQDRALQARELQQLQINAEHNLTRVTNVLFADGDVIEGAGCAVDIDTGTCTLEAGDVFIAGLVRAVGAATLQVDVAALVYAGVYMHSQTVTAVHDPDLYDQENTAPAFGEAGADRIKTTFAWGVKDDGQAGTFYPVWTIDKGVVRQRDPAPQLKVVSDAIALYDRESTGGYYVSSGFIVSQIEDTAAGEQQYSVSAGVARVYGKAVREGASRRVIFKAEPDTKLVQNEPHNSLTTGLQRIKFDNYPVLKPATVRVQRRKVVTITHAPLVGAADPLPDNSVVKINSVKSGGKTYVQGTDYVRTGSQVDWSPPGAEVGPGSQYDVDYEYYSTELARDQTATDFAIEGAVVDAVMTVDYEFALPRIDVVALDADANLSVVKGVPAVWRAVRPAIPAGLLPLALIEQTWDGRRRVRIDQVRLVDMEKSFGYQEQINQLKIDQAAIRLATDVAGRYSGLKRGQFADPMLNNDMREQGMAQTAMIAGGALQLHEAVEPMLLGDGATSYSIDYEIATSLQQPAYSQALTITPPAPPVEVPPEGEPEPEPPPVLQLPATVKLLPAVDRWKVEQELQYPVYSYTRNFDITGIGGSKEFKDQVDIYGNKLDASLLDTSRVFMREIDVAFEMTGFKPGELLQQVSFDGLVVQAKPKAGGTLVANVQGEITGSFKIPPGLPVGTKAVAFAGSAGNSANATFVGSADVNVNIQTYQSLGTSTSAGHKTVTYVV
ncbi:DUF4815 domain-containing protein [Comamonas sp. J-3]|uniref:DUF4815 domain-containing protein n=1 Tax=Comamonas trifloxystrobinivorans TaxID=3350256 RepID=UPI00372C416A